jgi:biotin synthase
VSADPILKLRRQPLDRAAIPRWLAARGTAQEKLFAAARAARDATFGPVAVVRGVVEVTSACVKDCLYCPMRAANRRERYFRRGEELLASARRVREAGLGVLAFQGGDVPRTTRTVGEIIPEVKREFSGEVEILLCLGDKPHDDYAYLRRQGADSYILKQETSDPALHRAMRGSELSTRLAAARSLASLGFRLGVGTIVGLPGQTAESLADDVLLAAHLGAKMTSASPFVPAPDTPLAEAPAGDLDTTLNVLAVMRLVHPRALIPTVSALETLAPGAQARGLAAGANVITVNFSPEADQARYPIYGQNRFVVRRDHAFRTLEAAGLEPLLGQAAFGFHGCADT